MSTLSTANIKSKAANTPPVIKDLNGTECGQFVKAWARIDHTSNSVVSNFNVASITDTATGRFTVNFTNAFSNANYAGVGLTGSQTGVTTSQRGIQRDGEWTTAAAQIRVLHNNGTALDDSGISLIFVGD